MQAVGAGVPAEFAAAACRPVAAATVDPPQAPAAPSSKIFDMVAVALKVQCTLFK